MEAFRTWAVTLGVFAVVVLLMRLLLPPGRIQKAGNAVISLVAVYLIVSPFGALLAKGTLTFPTLPELETQQSETGAAYEAALRSTIVQTLENAGVKVLEAELQTTVDAEQYLVLTGLRIRTNAPQTDAKIRTVLRESLGIPEEIVTIERGNDGTSAKAEGQAEG